VPGGFGFPLGFVAGILVTLVAVAAGATGHPMWSLLGLTLAVAGISAVTTAAAALATACVYWCLQTGFVLASRGELVLTAASLQAAAVLLSTAAIVVVVAAVVRRARACSRADERNLALAARIPAQRQRETSMSGGPGPSAPHRPRP
jgi:hypothetical protein